MRHEPNLRVENFRKVHPTLGKSDPGANWGYFQRGGLDIISSGTPETSEQIKWEHVSVSRLSRCPTWEEMCMVKKMFWQEDETVIQFHPCQEAYVAAHPYCLHLWKQVGTEYKLSPKNLLI